MTTKREAKFIMQLPDDYDYTFFKDTHIVGIRSDKPPIMYKIEGEKLLPCELVFAPAEKPIPVSRSNDNPHRGLNIKDGKVASLHDDSMEYKPAEGWRS